MLLKGLTRAGILVALVVICQGTWALAGTTGALTGYVTTPVGAAVVDAKVVAAAPSETKETGTDAAGHFAFVSLTPDTYTVTVSKDGYDTVSHAGITVIADNTRTVSLVTQPSVKTLGTVTTRAAAELVKPGTTADVYSVNEATSAKVANLGGGGSLNQAYSALAATPGVVVPPGQMGWFQTIHIRGGDFDQVGYEFDGVPVLRSYDNYPTTTANTLGQQELQVYTGAAPATSESQGLSGYINQVIKAGTYPGFSTLTVGVGAPAMYNGYNFEIGGATPDRNFSYFVGSSISSSAPRYIDQNQGASYQALFGTPFARLPCPSAPGPTANPSFAGCYSMHIGPGGYLLSSPIDSVFSSNVYDRENVINLHFGLPHHSDAGKDDIQLLYDASFLNNLYFSSASDWGMSDPRYQAAYGSPGISQYPYLSGNSPFGPLGFQYLGAVGSALSPNYKAMTVPVVFAYNPNNINSQYINANQRDGTSNPNSIVKVQFQHNFGSSAYFRIYGFSDYSEWPQTCPVTFSTNYIGYCPGNYYVKTNTNGASMSYGNQINDKNLLTFDLSDFVANDYRANDVTMINELEGLNHNTGADTFAYAVNANNPQAGICYNATGTPVSCYSANALAFGLGAANAGTALPALPGSCSGGPCEWFVAENGRYGGGNSAKPNFGSFSVTDQIKPSSQWFINIGAREDRFYYALSDTSAPAGSTAGGARTFWFNAWNNSYCVLPGGGQVPSYNAANDTLANSPCPAGQVQAKMTNLPNDTETFWVFQPRLGATFTANQDNVLRFSYGKYDQPPNTAYEQYNLLQQDLASYDATNFWPIGFTTTTHTIYPPTSNNYDLSWEHHFTGTEASFKLTPYYRQTKNQIQNFFLNQKTNFVSGLNVGNQTAEGVEFQLNMGNFNENGLSALLAYTYTHSYIRFSELGTGGTVLDTINLAIQQYNSFTKACVGATPTVSTTSVCGQFGGANATATEVSGVANPYFNAPAQSRLDPNANYIPFSTIPGGVEAASGSYEVPHTLALVLNFKHDKWAISPQFQYLAGSYYGDPLSGWGVDPSSCPDHLASGISGDPRYPYGGTGTPFNALTCTGKIAIPDPYTGVFDSLGAFRQPNQFLMHAQISYIASPRVTFTANFANIINSCSGGSAMPWTQFATHAVCDYILPGYAAPVPYGANIYNPGSTFQPEFQFPYQENPSAGPFEAVFSAKISL